MPRGRPSPKIAITVDPDVHDGIVAAAEVDGMSVSAWITDAAAKELRRRDGLAAIAEYEAEHGGFTAEELADARLRVAEQLAAAARTRPREQPPRKPSAT